MSSVPNFCHNDELSWVDSLLTDSEVFILFAENSQIRLKNSVIPNHFMYLENDIFFWFFVIGGFNFFSPMKISLAFIWGIIYFWTMDGFFRILEKTSSELITSDALNFVVNTVLYYYCVYYEI
jgi:hypothetical protein